MNNQELAKKLLNLVGGAKNVESLYHCVTRLRFTLKDEALAQEAEIKQLPGILGVQRKGGQYQIIVGTNVDKVEHEIKQLLGDITQQKPTKKGFSFNSLFDVLSSIIVKPMYAIAGGGILKGFLILFTTMGWLDGKGTEYATLNMIADSAFYFMPFLLAVSAAKKFKTNEYLALAIAATLFYPSVVDKEITLTFIGITIPQINYANSIIPIILAVWLLSYIYRFFDSKIPKSLSLFVTPLVVSLIMMPLTLIVLGPIGSYMGDMLAGGLQYLFIHAPWLAGIIIGGARPLLVITGMHHAIRPITLQQLSTFGYNLISPLNFVSTMAQSTAALGSYFTVKDKKVKALALSSATSGYMGITEPALYGVLLPLKRPLIATIIGGGVGGAYMATMGVQATTHAMSSVFSIPIFFGTTFMHFVIGNILGVAITFVLTLVLGTSAEYKEQEAKTIANNSDTAETKETTTQTQPLTKTIEITSPLAGTVLPLSDVNDATFSQSTLGNGVAIIPAKGKIIAPFDGEVSMVFHTKHAIGLTSSEGVELLIHIGIDTVNLEGKYFTALVEQNTVVKKGQPLIQFDIKAIQEAGYDITTPIVITNTKDYLDVLSIQEKNDDIIEGEALIHVFK